MSIKLKRKSGFTLIELLAVITIICLMAALLFPVLQAVRLRAQIRKARTESRELAKAWEAYWMHYPTTSLTWPITMTSDKVKILQGDNLANNKDNIKFMDFPPEARDGGFKDPWGREYVVEVLKSGVAITNLEYKTKIYFPNRKAQFY